MELLFNQESGCIFLWILIVSCAFFIGYNRRAKAIERYNMSRIYIEALLASMDEEDILESVLGQVCSSKKLYSIVQKGINRAYKAPLQNSLNESAFRYISKQLDCWIVELVHYVILQPSSAQSKEQSKMYIKQLLSAWMAENDKEFKRYAFQRWINRIVCITIIVITLILKLDLIIFGAIICLGAILFETKSPLNGAKIDEGNLARFKWTLAELMLCSENFNYQLQ